MPTWSDNTPILMAKYQPDEKKVKLQQAEKQVIFKLSFSINTT